MTERSLQGLPAILKAKICLVGENAVGKTSLVRRYVLDQFDDRYLTTLGAKVMKKEVRVENPKHGRAVLVDLAIWDIMGQPSFRDLLREAYFGGAQGILAVADLTRKETLDNLPSWIEAVVQTVGPVPVVVAANKADLAEQAKYEVDEVESVLRISPSDRFLTSAKTGALVNATFGRLASLVADAQLNRSHY